MPTGCWDPGGPSDPWVCPWRLQAEFRPGCPLLSVRDECQGQCRRWARTRSVPEGAPRKRGPHYPPQFHCPSCLLSQARTGSGGSGPLRPGAASRVLTPGPCRHSSPVPHPGTRAPLCPIFPPLLPFTGRTVARLPAEVLPSPAPVPFPLLCPQLGTLEPNLLSHMRACLRPSRPASLCSSVASLTGFSAWSPPGQGSQAVYPGPPRNAQPTFVPAGRGA